MKLLLVVANFVPEIGSAAHIYFDLARAFVKRGHDVHVITSYPRKFNLSKADAEMKFSMDETIDGVHVHRCKHNAIRDNLTMRGIEHFILPYYYFRTYLRINKIFDACIIYVPPLPLYYFARAIKKFYGVPSILNYQDFHPQELTDVGVLKNGLLIKIMEYIERQSYKNADFITVLSDGGIHYVTSRGGNPSKIEHIYNSCKISDLNKPPTRYDFKKKEGIENKTLITYAGILSPFQGMDNILEAAKGLKGQNDLIFYIIGEGLIKGHLAQRIKNEDITNVRLMSLQPRDEYFNIINSSDISLISLDDRMKAPCIPGKILNLMAAKQPIIAVVPIECETAKVIEKSNCGIVVIPSNTDDLKKTIIRLKDSPLILNELGKNGRDYFEKNMNMEKILLKYETIIYKLIR